MPAAGLATGHYTRIYNHGSSHYEPMDPTGWSGNLTMKQLSNCVYPAPEYVPRSLLTEDLPGARPRSRPGLGMGNIVTPNGMAPLRTSIRSSNPLMPNHELPVHRPQPFVVPTWRPSPLERDQKKSGLGLEDIEGSSPNKAKPQRKDYDSLNYRDVSGAGRYKPVFDPRSSSSLRTRDIQGAKPMTYLKTRTRPGEVYDLVEKSSPARPPYYGLGRWPPPSVVHSSFPRVGRDSGVSVAVFTMPKPQRAEFAAETQMVRDLPDVPQASQACS